MDMKIKRCPFCGGEAELRRNEGASYLYSYVKCTNYECGSSSRYIRMNPEYSSDDKAIKVWNTRVPEVVVDDITLDEEDLAYGLQPWQVHFVKQLLGDGISLVDIYDWIDRVEKGEHYGQ